MGNDFKYYTDIHSHIIPGVDDGASDIGQSVRMLQIAHENHINRIILTPHNKPHTVNAAAEVLKKNIGELRQKIVENHLDIELFEGMEVYYRGGVEEMLDEGELWTLAGSDNVLVEFSPMEEYSYITRALFKLQDYGYNPVLAHVERYDAVVRKAQIRVMELREQGILIQVNAGSIMGEAGRTVQKFCKMLLKKRLVDFVATDAHHDTKRSPELEACAKYLYKKFDKCYVDKILFENANRIIFGNRI